ncbi:UNVERIFIED_CONTAM: hypothetical protein Sradi_5254200 [Sesamum radiatum]|uniref:Retrotransposon gag domain-containing protein n=1 Tax=Sesamum radiatum TaxID=300843 RepID=A0AAW2LMG9_SESRA
MGPRWGAVTRSSSAGANMVGKEPESPRRTASPSGQAAIPEDETSRLAGMVMNLEEKRAVSNAHVVAHDTGARLRIPEPKGYGSAHDAKEVENSLFDMEQYFLAANIENEARKVSIATMYLTGDAKLWWRTKYSEIQANQV